MQMQEQLTAVQPQENKHVELAKSITNINSINEHLATLINRIQNQEPPFK